MSRFKLIFAIIVICIASTYCAIFEGHKKDGGPRSQDDQLPCIPGNIVAAHFIDGSGTNPDAIYHAANILDNNPLSNFCNAYRFIVAGVSYEYVPWPGNITRYYDMPDIGDWLDYELRPYRGIFDLQTSVNTFFTLPQYSSYDPLSNRPPWAIIYAYSDTVGGINNLLNGVTRLQSEGYTVLLFASQLPRYKMSQLLQVLSQSNIASPCHGEYVSSVWLLSRYNAGYTVPTVNQTGTSGYITSPNYPDKYPIYNIREYYITAPSTSYTILLTINDFELDIYHDDYLFVYQGPIMDDDDFLYRWHGNVAVQNFTIQSNTVTLRFLSSFTHDVTRGFNISWTAIPNPPEEKSDNLIR